MSAAYLTRLDDRALYPAAVCVYSNFTRSFPGASARRTDPTRSDAARDRTIERQQERKAKQEVRRG